MAANPTPLPLDLAELLESWKYVLRTERKAHTTFASYTTGVLQFLRWCEEQGETPALDRGLVTRWVAALLASGLEPTTVKGRQLAVRRFSAWLDGEDDIDYRDQLLGLRPPRIAEKLVQPLTEAELRLMILACEGKALRDRRDEAVIRLMAETGLRAGEVLALQTTDLNMAAGVASIRKAKSGRGRVVPFSPKTAVAIDRYLRLRRSASTGGQAQPVAGGAWARAELCGVAGVAAGARRDGRNQELPPSPAAAHRRLPLAGRGGGSEQGLMSVAGWSDRSMLDRYTRATAGERAMDEARGLGSGGPVSLALALELEMEVRMKYRNAMTHCDNLIEVHKRAGTGSRGRKWIETSVNRAVVVIAIASWQAAVQDITRFLLKRGMPELTDPNYGFARLIEGQVIRELAPLLDSERGKSLAQPTPIGWLRSTPALDVEQRGGSRQARNAEASSSPGTSPGLAQGSSCHCPR